MEFLAYYTRIHNNPNDKINNLQKIIDVFATQLKIHSPTIILLRYQFLKSITTNKVVSFMLKCVNNGQPVTI